MEESAGGKRKRDDSPVSASDQRKAKVSAGQENLKQRRVPRFTRPHELRREPITLKDVTDLLLYASLGKSNGVKKPSWCRLHHQGRVARVHVVVLEGAAQLHFYRYYSQFKHLRKEYTARCTLAPPSGDLLSALLRAELPSPPSSPDIHTAAPTAEVAWHPVARRYGLKRRGLSSYLLTEEEMIKKNFPVKGGCGCEGYVCTQTDDHVTDSSPLYGLDCEMCVTQAGAELTRVAVVDSRGRCVLDELVKPFNPVINYCTKFSGITQAILKPVTTRLQDIQSKLVELLPRDAVLVGHSLDNDLRALKLIHPHVLDSSLLYRREFGQRFKLKHLAQVILKREIQTEERTGHDPCEDACAALQVVQYFLSKGPRQVLDLHLEDLWGVPPRLQQAPVNGALNESLHNPTISPLRFGQALHKAGQSVLLLCESAMSDSLSSNQVWRCHSCNTDKESVCVFRRVAHSYSLSVVQFSSLSDILKQTPDKSKDWHLQQMLCRLEQMCVLFVGPLPSGYTEKKLHTLFRQYGDLQTITLLQKTHGLYARVEFKHLEGAQLALHSLNGHQEHNQIIKVQRPLSEATLDLEPCLAELQSDALNGHMIYVAGLSPHHHRHHDLLQAFSSFGPIDNTVTPAKKSGKCRRHTHIEFVSAESVSAAIGSQVLLADRKLSVCCALTPPHMHTWTHTHPVTMVTGGETANQEEEERAEPESSGLTCTQDVVMEHVMRALDRNVGKMFKALEDRTLSIVILPGCRSGSVEYSGLCFVEVKQA